MRQAKQSVYVLAALAALSTLAAGSSVAGTAQSATAFDVKVTIASGCTIANDSAAVNFGTVIGTSSKPSSQSKTATITCTTGVPYDFHVTSANGLKMSAGGNTFIPYTIKAGTNTTALGTTTVTSGFSQTGSGSAQTVTFTFDIASWTPSAPYGNGTYTDTVTLSVDF